MKNENSGLLARAAVGLGLALWRTPQAKTAVGQVIKGAKDLSNYLTTSNNAQTTNTGTTTGKMGTDDGSPNGNYGGSFGASPSNPGNTDEAYKGKALRDILTLKED